MVTKHEVKSLILELFDAYNKEDWDLLFSKYLTEDCIFITGNESIKGKKEIVAAWEINVIRVRKEILLEPTNILVDGNQIASEVPLKVQFKVDSDFGGILFKKGHEIYTKCGDFYQLQGGKVCSITVYRLTPWGFQVWKDNWDEYEKLALL